MLRFPTLELIVTPGLPIENRFLFQLPDPLLQEVPLWFLLGQGQSFLIRGPSFKSLPLEEFAGRF